MCYYLNLDLQYLLSVALAFKMCVSSAFRLSFLRRQVPPDKLRWWLVAASLASFHKLPQDGNTRRHVEIAASERVCNFLHLQTRWNFTPRVQSDPCPPVSSSSDARKPTTVSSSEIGAMTIKCRPSLLAPGPLEISTWGHNPPD